MDHVLQSESSLANLPYDLSSTFISKMDEDNNWEKVAMVVSQYYGEDMMNDEDIHILRQKRSPGSGLLEKLQKCNFIIYDLQGLLWRSELIDILNLLVTNERAEIIAPVGDVEISVELGQSRVLKVVTFGSPYPTFQWHCNNKILIGETSDKLQISCFSMSDVGEYICRAKQNLSGVVEEIVSPRFKLTLANSLPTVLPGKNLKDISLESGKDLVLECEFLAEPKPTYIWYKDGQELMSNSSNTYKIFNVGVMNAGIYFCKAVNTLGECCSNEAKVNVSMPCFAPDYPVIIMHPEVHSQYVFSHLVNLVFTVHCRHEVHFSCLINDKSLKDYDNEHITFTTQMSAYYYHTLNLHYKVNKEDWCRGNNGPIVIQFEAHSNGSSVTSTVTIVVKEDFTQKKFLARNKFALLIANEEYSEQSLQTPVEDTKALVKKLTTLEFRCMICRNVTQTEFLDIVNLFSRFIQHGDYVFFYYAGHGYHYKGEDYMIPLHANTIQTLTSARILQENACVTITEVWNKFQKKTPALIFNVIDMCRGTPNFSYTSRNLQAPSKIAKGNTITIYATSESYPSFEDASSLLIKGLITLITLPITVQDLGTQFMNTFNDGNKCEKPQMPRIDVGIHTSRSLTDAWTPQYSDYDNVLAEWEKMSNTGGEVFQKVKVNDIVLGVKVKCEQDRMVISNCIDIVINITIEKPGKVKSIQESGLTVCIAPRTAGKEMNSKVTEDAITFPLMDLQALNDDVWLSLTFMEKDLIVEEIKFNLGRPSLCNIQNYLCNELNG